MTLHTTTSMTLVPPTIARKQDKNNGLLSTKLSIPPARPTLVPRDSLIAKLNNGLRRGYQLTLVSAPAGAGKTTLLSSWLRQLAALHPANQANPSPKAPLGLAWLTLDHEDNQPMRFWSYLISALQTIDADLGREAQRLLAAPQRPPIRTMLSALLNDLAAYSDQIILVLDDFEAIAAAAIHKGITFIADHAPTQLHLVLSSRADPPLPLARLRAHNQLAEVRGKELDFTLAETAAFLSDMTGMPWRNTDAWALHARTEGWAAGLQIAGLELQKLLAESSVAQIGYAIARFTDGFSGNHQDIREFLEQEVLRRQPEYVQAFLICTSFLEQLNGSLCDSVTGQTGSQELLERLDKANLFVVPVESAPPWYRYQRMFAEVLQARLRQAQPELAALLHRRAAEWYAAHGEVAEPSFAGRDVIVVDPPTDQALSTYRPARARASLPSLSGVVREHALGEATSVTGPALDQDHEIVQLVEQLTPRELEILRLIAEDLSYVEISNRLVIGLNTVRFHVKNIYGKLDVHRRAQAITRAKQLHVLLP
jgi:LuxR family transcriptional regulator, maltose regulon positive regulatory protein